MSRKSAIAVELQKEDASSLAIDMGGKHFTFPYTHGKEQGKIKDYDAIGPFIFKYTDEDVKKAVKRIMKLPQLHQDTEINNWLAAKVKVISGMDVHPEDYAPVFAIMRKRIFEDELAKQPKLTEFDKDKEIVTGHKRTKDSEELREIK